MKQVQREDKRFAVPDEARYVAQDADGVWGWYTLAPHENAVDLEWLPHKNEKYKGFGFLFKADPPKDYTRELYEL